MNNEFLINLRSIVEEYNELKNQLEDIEIINNNVKFSNISRKMAKMSNKYEKASLYLTSSTEIEEALSIIKLEDDVDTIKSFEEMIINLEKNKIILEEELNELIFESDPNDSLNAIIEITGQAGGDEANLFAGDLFRMYLKFSSKIGFKLEIIESSATPQGGFSTIVFLVKGPSAYGVFKHESGVHRVQRVPATESQGRVHTSTASVVVMPEVDNDINIKLLSSDLRIDTYRASGSGGQHINKTDSAVRITHLPSGVVGQSQEGRSQHDNKDRAMNMLKSKLYDLQLQEELSKSAEAKKKIVGSGDRSEKIRTYNYSQNRVTDHRVGLTLKKLDRIMDGNLDEVIDFINDAIKKNVRKD
jgi:peptide chain release factor 1